MKMIFGKRWLKKLKKDIGRFEFEVGILEDGPHYDAVETGRFEQPQLKSYAGGPARKQSRHLSESSTGEIFVQNQERLNRNLLLEPFQDKSSDLLKFTDAFLKLAMKRGGITIKRVENLLQAVVRNPILRQEYGPNTAATADAKGFSRALIDTSQMFRAIKARAKRV